MYQIKMGDCLSLMKEIPAGSVDLILCDLPYGILDYEDRRGLDLQLVWEIFRRVLKKYRAVVLFASARFTIKLAASNFDWYKYKWIWVKNICTQFIHAKNRPLSTYEEVLVFSEGAVNHAALSGEKRMPYNPQGVKSITAIRPHGNKGNLLAYAKISKKENYLQDTTNYPRDVLNYNAPHNSHRHHPNEKLVDLLEYLIRTYSNEGETVLDATMGSGSTGVACVNTGRNFIGYELNEKYFEVAKNRIEKAVAEKQSVLEF